MKSINKILLLVAMAILLTVYQNCSPMEGNTLDEAEKSSQNQQLQSNFNDIFSKVIQPKCLLCHSSFNPGAGYDYTDHASLMESGSVVPGNADASSFYTSLVEGTMPPGNPLDSQSIAAIGEWINDGARDTKGQIGNKLPIVNAGNDLYIYEPQNTFTLMGFASDSDGTIVSKTWSQIAGPKALTIVSPNTLTTDVNGLITLGLYEFELKVEDDRGDIVTDRIKVSLNPYNNLLPVVSAGLDVNIQVPASSANLTAYALDSDGSIATYQWSQDSGPNTASFNNTTMNTATVSGLVLGTYEFKITVTDNKGATASDLVKVIVDPMPIARSFTDINNTIFKPKCLNCHRGVNARGGYNMETYDLIMTLVVKNNANESELFVRCWDNTMPPAQPLNKDEKDKIRDWINTGAPNN